MSYASVLAWEIAQLVISTVGLVLSIAIVRDARRDRIDAELAGELISADALDMAKERLIAAIFLCVMSAFLMVSSLYAIALVDVLASASDKLGLKNIQIQSVILRVGWRAGVTGFAYVRWVTRERIRRKLKLA